MEVLNDRASVLSNFEVLELLKEEKQRQENQQKDKRSKALSTVCYEATSYLKKLPAARQSAESIAETVRKLKPFELTAAETMQLINIHPTSATEIQLIVEESEERFKTEAQLNSLLKVIGDNLSSASR